MRSFTIRVQTLAAAMCLPITKGGAHAIINSSGLTQDSTDEEIRSAIMRQEG